MHTKRSVRGFTIIEVLIVLAIAGLILLIVFLAVPALQRNSRNSSRRNDVASLLTGMSEFADNNNGTLPNKITGNAGDPVTFTCASGSCTSSTAKVSYFTGGTVNCAAVNPSQVYLCTGGTYGPYHADYADLVALITGGACTTDTNGEAVTKVGSSRGFAALYEIENGSGTFASACQAP